MSCVVIGDSNWASTNVHLVVGLHILLVEKKGVFMITHTTRDNNNNNIPSEIPLGGVWGGMINERMSNNERSTDQPPHSVAWEDDVYSKVLGNKKSGYVHGLE
ncbi:hypothetical protein H5410_040655 [Solanum commersonii]|uniref:Uncharacterized protein n=1 Tax=Solanum commersonii TaxID=4109 RepID=A0A9J5XQR8_SOLCO|nr:hypothetical protein H5410_040655 [Solanum commersonii]